MKTMMFYDLEAKGRN
jgi:hypothetical protein